MVTPETLRLMVLLVEDGLVDVTGLARMQWMLQLLVDGGLVDEHVIMVVLVEDHEVVAVAGAVLVQDDGLVDDHVVIVLVVGHEAVADRQEVVADRQESLEKGSKFLFLLPCVFYWLGIIVAVSAGRCAASTLTATHPTLQIL